ncbi:hypothetical protein [Streptacidiphilus sp. P02-A3a]|uniref:hypothetical protein n=1 Tax=Streptacidiphilus sp. P02-A3a TaxID=2704468 RepID=UPI0015FE6DF4|nr:hypothetical protein [Streptacidiphilus sp. P02-A3a]QMU71772.1 hypothetical protein GXP74_29555 [Streptacidiphilus sp. P02-A3a]
MDVASAAEVVAAIAATGAVGGLGEEAASHAVEEIRTRINSLLGRRRRAALRQAIENPTDQSIGELAQTLTQAAHSSADLTAALHAWANLNSKVSESVTFNNFANRAVFNSGGNINFGDSTTFS